MDASGRGTIVCCEMLVRPLRALFPVIEGVSMAAQKRTWFALPQFFALEQQAL